MSVFKKFNEEWVRTVKMYTTEFGRAAQEHVTALHNSNLCTGSDVRDDCFYSVRFLGVYLSPIDFPLHIKWILDIYAETSTECTIDELRGVKLMAIIIEFNRNNYY